MGVKEQLIFPSKTDQIDKVRGMDIIFVTTAKTDEEAELLRIPWVHAIRSIIRRETVARKAIIENGVERQKYKTELIQDADYVEDHMQY